MPRLSLVIIARDEADRIRRAIDSVPFADEVVVLDSGSTDGTPEIARSSGAVVHIVDWPGHVAQKNRALGEATGEWVLSLDADERLSARLAASVQAVLANPDGADGYAVDRLNHYLGRPILHGDWYPDRRVRLAKREKARWTGQDPHDVMAVDGRIGHLEGPILHDPYRSIGDQVRRLEAYSQRFAEVTGQRATLVDVLGRPIWALLRGFVFKAGFRDGVRGWMIAFLVAAYTMLKWSRLYVAQREGGQGGPS